jgi:hypothetical protein
MNPEINMGMNLSSISIPNNVNIINNGLNMNNPNSNYNKLNNLMNNNINSIINEASKVMIIESTNFPSNNNINKSETYSMNHFNSSSNVILPNKDKIALNPNYYSQNPEIIN